VAIDPSSARAHANLGEALRTIRRHDQALDHLRKAATLDSMNVQAWNSLGLVALDACRYAAAERAFREAIRLQPRLAHAHVNLAGALRLLGRFDEAMDHERLALKLDSDGHADSGFEENVDARNDLHVEVNARQAAPAPVSPAQAQCTKGQAHLAEGQLDQAEDCLREALRLDSTLADAWVALAGIQAERGNFELSCQSARAALAVRANAAEAYWRLASNLQGQLPDADVQAMHKLAGDESLSNNDRALLYFGLATVLDQRGLYAEAALHHTAANAQQAAAKLSRGRAHDPERYSRFIDRIIASFSAELLARGRGWGDCDPRPVFVVGFPRSGTTLTEQVLASHPQVKGVGELLELHHVFQSLPAIVGLRCGDSFDALPFLEPVSVKAAARRYLDKLDELAPASASRIVDKMPDNVIQLGLIALLFPNAKVIICRRDPRDIAVSCWQTGFRTSAWNNDWNHLARRLADYQRILAHWERVQPLPYLELRYEDMVAEFEHHARLLIDFVGLDWDPSCLEFHSNPRVVRTPSLAQVRQPIHSRSAGRWRNYEPYLQPLFQALERYGVVV
jgi:tetratricopeptide (TPR) repeat protein